MLDWVSKREYQDERDRRVAAEARETELREQLKFLRELVTSLGLHPASLPDAPAETPAPARPPMFTGDTEPEVKGLSSRQILSIPAIGRRGLAQREPYYQAALAREKGDGATNRPQLTAEEIAEADRAFQQR